MLLDAKNIASLRAAVARAKEKKKYDRLVDFLRGAWPLVEGTNEYKHNWHIDMIAEHLEAMYNGEIKNLLINVPPGCMKSLIVSVCFPAWVWSKNPEARFLTASYAQELSTRDAVKTRHIIESDWFQGLWPSVRIQAGEATKTKYQLTRGGWRLSTSVGGRATGEHPDWRLCDDPHNAREAQSELERQAALDWYDYTLSTRGASRGARTAIVMQRLHEKDLSGHVMAKLDFREEWTHICLPMRYEPERMLQTVLGARDPRGNEGALLWPELFPEKVVDTLETTLGEYQAAGQLQQRPAPASGGIIKISHFKLWPKDKPLPDFSFVLQSLDTAYTTNTLNDPTACSVWGVFEHERRPCVMLLDYWTEWLDYPALRQRVIADWGAKYGGRTQNRMQDQLHPPRGVDVLLIEKKGSGQSLLDDLRRANVGAVSYDPGRSDKIARAIQATALLETGGTYLLESARETGKPITWCRSLLKEMEFFPNAEHDDGVDTWSQAMIFLRDKGLLNLPAAPDDMPEERDYEAERRSTENPYLV